MWDLIASVPDHCFSCYLLFACITNQRPKSYEDQCDTGHLFMTRLLSYECLHCI